MKEQSKDIENHYKQVDKQLKEFEKVLKDEENKGIMEGVKAKIKEAKKKAEEYDQIFDPDQLFNVADIIVENKLLIDRVDAILGRQEKSNIYDLPSRTDVSGVPILETGRQGGNKSSLTQAEEEELSVLSQTLIDELYNQFSRKEHSSKVSSQPAKSRKSSKPKTVLTTQFGKPVVQTKIQK